MRTNKKQQIIDFSEWCQTKHPIAKTAERSAHYITEGFRNNNKNWEDTCYSTFFDVINNRIENAVNLDISVDYTGNYNDPITTPHLLGQREDDSIDITTLDLKANVPGMILENLNIFHLKIQTITRSSGVIKLINCRVKHLSLRDNSRVETQNSQIGTLALINEKSVSHLIMQGGCILNIRCPQPKSPSPFSGSVTINNVFLPRNRTEFLLSSAQPYRNMRHHLSEIGNTHIADLFHSAELAVERQDDTTANKIFSYGYEWFSDFGSSALRPIIWLLSLFVLSWGIIAISDGATLAMSNLDVYAGWRWELLSDDFWGHIKKSGYLALQPIVNPLGLFQTKALIVPTNGAIGIWLIIQSLFSIIFITLMILAIRRRFKMQ